MSTLPTAVRDVRTLGSHPRAVPVLTLRVRDAYGPGDIGGVLRGGCVLCKRETPPETEGE